MSTSNEPPQRGTRRRGGLSPTWISSIAALIVVVASTAFLVDRPGAPTQPVGGSQVQGTPLPSPSGRLASPSPAVSSASATANQIRFLQPQNDEQVKRCPVIDGSGQIPADEGLWIIVVPDPTAKHEQYWIESPAKMDGPEHWSATERVYIDSTNSIGVNAYIYAVLLDKKWSDYFAASSAEGNLSARSLPPTATIVAGPVSVMRVADPGGQSCHPVIPASSSSATVSTPTRSP
jgi:hypothetical protein